MATFKVLVDSYINNAVRKAGEEVEYTGEAGPNLEPVNKAAEKQVSKLPQDVARLVTAVRLHAASRGVSPSEVTASDLTEVLATLKDVSKTAIAGASAELGLTDQTLA